ncbi:uncharacterized protein [Venturia canescens]|uniref:uncharacterized protein isoform X2 n=1 Tax=Venturia canescens TaxID=32260 RepID=UPI001C9C9093|nr:uncharacterized protein LOC122419480 isoform X2 [Venturia canescens]
MVDLRWICWYLLKGVPTLFAFPIESSQASDSDFWKVQWEYWPQYTLGILSFVVVASTLVGCLCCQRQRRPKGFQDDAATGKEFKDGSTAGTETTIERVPSSSLELEVPRRISTPSREKILFDEILLSNYTDGRSALKPPSSSLYNNDDNEENEISRNRGKNEWYEGENFPREKLKYLREIGRGWFGKVVEGMTVLEEGNVTMLGKNRGVVVRILTEGATSREKSWFLGESTPYLKLRHPNVLELLGFCLETDPFLLLFESCPVGDLKNFLLENRETGDALRKENVPMRMALNIANALEHMHENGFAHTDLSARNCLVAHDLTAKLGDYGVGVEKYPGDYYIVGDRALPIRWSAPESLECTETTIETRAITPHANVWSYGVLLWEIASWAERPYDHLCDEQVIELIFSPRSEKSVELVDKFIAKHDLPANFREALEATWKFAPTERSSLRNVREILCGKKMEDFEQRWENLKPNGPCSVDKSASLQDLRGSMDSGLCQANSYLDKNSLRANFRLGPEEEPVVNCASIRETICQTESGSETEEESWRGRVERGAYTEKVKQKSKSVADLMVLVHIDSDSDVESSLGPQNIDKPMKKRLPPSGSDGDLRRGAVIADEFDEALRKLRDPSNVANSFVTRTTKSTMDHVNTDSKVNENVKIVDNIVQSVEINEIIEKPKLLTLTSHQGKTPILRLSFGGNPLSSDSSEPNLKDDSFQNEERVVEKIEQDTTSGDKNSSDTREFLRNEEPVVLRLVSKGNPDLPLLRYIPERSSTPVNPVDKAPSDAFLVSESREAPPLLTDTTGNGPNSVDVELWNDALGEELEKKNPLFVENVTIFHEYAQDRMLYFDNSSTAPLDKDAGFHKKNSNSGSSTPKSLQSFPVSSCPSGTRYNFSAACLSAPATPRRNDNLISISGQRLRDRRKEEMRKKTDYYPDDCVVLRGSLSAPETPFRRKYNEDSSTCEDLDEERHDVKDSAPDTPQSRCNYSVGNADEDLSSVGDELEPAGIMKRSSHEVDDEEDRKHLSTPDDERSSDSGFRDKESCEEEESPIPGSQVLSSIEILGTRISCVNLKNSSPLFSASAEEEQMRILFELDTILDAEYYGNSRDPDKIDDTEISLEINEKLHFEDTDEIAEKIRSISESHGSTESTDILETVRANSCDANFLDHFFSSKDDTNQDSKFEYFNDTSSADLLESMEVDSVSDECSIKIEENRLSSKKEDLMVGGGAHSSCESPIKTSDKSPSTDSSAELIRLNIDSSETPSDIMKNESISSEISPIKTDRNSFTDGSLDLQIVVSDSTSSSDKDALNKVASFDDISKVLSQESKSFSSHNIDSKTNEINYVENCSSNLPLEEDSRNTQLKNPPAGSDSEIINLTSPSIEEEFSSSRSEDVAEISTRAETLITDFESINQDKLRTNESFEAQEKKTETETENSICLPHGAERRNFQGDDAFEYSSEDSQNLCTFVDRADDGDSTIENHDKIVCSSNELLLIRDENRGSNISVDALIQRDPLNSDVEQWSWRENINEINDDNEEDSSTMSLKSDNSYVSFGLDEAFVTAIRNELTEKLPRAQMPVVEALDPHDETETATASINPETTAKHWGEDEEIDSSPERSSVDISIRYNIYGTPLSPILEERESAATSESLFSKEESADASIASRVSALSEDVLVVDTLTNRAIIVEAGANGGNVGTLDSQQDEDRDTSHGDISDEENLEYPQNHFNRGFGNKKTWLGSGGAPLPSPEEESKWQQQFPLPLQMQDDLMSTSFGTDRDWDSQDDEEGEDEVEEGDDDEEENSSSSGEFVWKRYDDAGDLEKVATRSPPSKPKSHETEVDLDEEAEEEGDDGEEEDDEEEEEFTPSAWDATLAPHRSALRSPEKNLKTGDELDQKKSVWFKKQRYHCVYEYPKETLVVNAQGQVATTWEPTSYTDWEDMMNEPARLDIYPIEYDETNRAGDEEFYVSSSNRPFQFQSGDGKYVSQFFPGASTTLLQHESQHQISSSSSLTSPRDVLDLRPSEDEVDRIDDRPLEVSLPQANGNSRSTDFNEGQQQAQLGELRHTRDRLKLNLLSTNGSTKTDGEVVSEILPRESENVDNIGTISEQMKVSLKTEKHLGNLKNLENPDRADMMEAARDFPSPDSQRAGKESLTKLEVDSHNIDESADKSGKKTPKCDNETKKLKTSINKDYPLQTENKLCDTEGIDSQEKVCSDIDVVEQSSNLKILCNLSVIETSKIDDDEDDNNKREKKDEAVCGDDGKVANENADDKVKDVKESTTFGNDEKMLEVRSTDENFQNCGDQKEESSKWKTRKDPRKYEHLEISILEAAVIPSSSNDTANSALVVSTSINDSSKNGKNMGEIKETEMVQSLTQS